MPDNNHSNIATADVLLLHNQHTLAAAIEEVSNRFARGAQQYDCSIGNHRKKRICHHRWHSQDTSVGIADRWHHQTSVKRCL